MKFRIKLVQLIAAATCLTLPTVAVATCPDFSGDYVNVTNGVSTFIKVKQSTVDGVSHIETLWNGASDGVYVVNGEVETGEAEPQKWERIKRTRVFSCVNGVLNSHTRFEMYDSDAKLACHTVEAFSFWLDESRNLMHRRATTESTCEGAQIGFGVWHFLLVIDPESAVG